MADNGVTLTGNTTRASELRFSNSGLAIGSFGLAVNERKLENGEWVDGDTTTFVDVTAFGKLAENITESLPDKGVRVTVLGKLKQSSWDDKETGAKRTKHEIIADEVSISLKFATVGDVAKNTRP